MIISRQYISLWFRGKIYKRDVDITLRVSDWWRHLWEYLGRNVTNYFMYLMGRYKRAPRGVCMLSPPPPSLLKFINLLHANQAGVQHFICNLTDTHASTLWHGHKGARLISGWTLVLSTGRLEMMGVPLPRVLVFEEVVICHYPVCN